jgi:hypothetical protein
MDVLDTARELGLFAEDEADAVGGIAEQVVLDALSSLAAGHENEADLFAEAALRVQLARSAGVEQVAADSVFARRGAARTEQFRYRSEMRDVFTDLAIDLGIRTSQASLASLEAGLVGQGADAS